MNSIPAQNIQNTPVPAAAALPAPSPAATAMAESLLSHLAPLYPSIAAATRSTAGADAWIDSWARQITLSGLSAAQIARGLTRLARGEHDPGVPLSWSVFYRLCYDPFRDVSDSLDEHERERRMREFRARFPNARFVNCLPQS